MCAYLLNMWVTKRIDETYLTIMVTKGFITQSERDLIIATPQI